MTKEKQIEEIAKIIVNGCREGNCEECKYSEGVLYPDCMPSFTADTLYNAGYRKADEVAEELERYLRVNEDIALKCKEENGEQNREYWKGKLSAFKQIRAYIDAELKKKYTEISKEITEEGK